MPTSLPPIPRAGAHGGDGPAIAAALGMDPSSVLDLSQTLNPFAPDVEALAARHLDSLRRYPDPAAATSYLAAAVGVDGNRVLLTNGGSEAISLVAAELGGSVRAEPEFSLHPRGTDGPTWRTDPHSPSGLLATDDDTSMTQVWDEAFYPLATGRWTAGRPGVVVGSLTKVFACPGLRLGYVIAESSHQRDAFAARQPEWSVNSLALALLPHLLAASDLAGWCARIASARQDLGSVLAAHGFAAEPSDAPWLLVEAPGLRDALAPHGIVVRDCTSFAMPNHVRIAVPDADGLDRLDAALRSLDQDD